MNVSSAKLDRSTLIKFAITVGIPVLILLIPYNEVFTANMRMAIAATVGLLTWSALELTDFTVPCIIWASLLMVTNAVPAKDLFAPYLSMTVYGAISMIIFATVMARIGVLRRLAFWIAKKTGGTFGNLVFAVFFAVFGIAAATFTGGVIVSAAFIYGMCAALGILKTKEGAILTMTGILGIGTVRMFWAYPITIGALETSVRTVEPNFTLSFITMLKYNFPCLFFILLLIYLMLVITKTKNKPILGGKEYFETEYAKMGKLNRDEIIGTIVAVLILLFVMTGPLHGYNMMYGFAFFAMFLFLPGINVGKKEDIQSFPLGTLLFVVSCMSIGNVCIAVGIVKVITVWVQPILASLGSTWSLFGVLIFGTAANICMTPMAVFGGFSGMLYNVFSEIGINPLTALFTLNYGTDLVFLPYEYTTPLLFMAFGTMTMKDFVKLNVLKNALFFIFFLAIIIPFWNLIGLL